MNLVITGAGGFLGRNLLEQGQKMFRKELKIIAVTGQKTDSNIIAFGREEFFTGYQFNDTDILINCAFPRNKDGFQMANGLDYIVRLLEKAASEGAVINISSQSVYSQKRLCTADERTQLSLESEYAIGKYATELMINSLCRCITHTNIMLCGFLYDFLSKRRTIW